MKRRALYLYSLHAANDVNAWWPNAFQSARLPFL